MLRMNVSGGYSDFKAVVGALGKPSAVFWSRITPLECQMWALTEAAIVTTKFAVPAKANPASPPDPLAVGASPLAPAPTQAAPAAVLQSGVAPASPQVIGSIVGAADNGNDAIRLTLTAQLGGNVSGPRPSTIEVDDVLGTTEANGVWPFNIVDALHVDLIGSHFVHPYISGGTISVPAAANPAPVSRASTAQPAGKAERPKTVMETDFPGAVEIPGGAIEIS